MAFVRRNTSKDATWARAWTADAVADLSSIAAIAGPNGPRHGDIAFVTANSNYYLWLDNGSWAQITEIAETDGANIFSDLDAIDLRRAGTVRIGLRNTSAGADLKQWYVRVSGVVFQLQTVDDVGSSPVVLVESDRNGNLTLTGSIAAFAGQIGFPATQNPSAGANVLDDYEEGTWTPVLSFGGGTTGITYTTQAGIYVKVGQLVLATFRFDLSNKGSSTGSALISGLPFTSSAIANSFGLMAGSGSYAAFAGLADGLTGAVNNNATNAALQFGGAANVTNLTEANFTNTTALISGYIYRAAA